jgi:hypothetical protein
MTTTIILAVVYLRKIRIGGCLGGRIIGLGVGKRKKKKKKKKKKLL